jgi:hypothetical protein
MTELACECGNTDCATAARDGRPPSTAVIHVVADSTTMEAAQAETARATVPPPATPDAGVPAPVAEELPVPAPAVPDVDATSTVRQGHLPPGFCPAPAAEGAATSRALCPAPPAFVIGAGVMPAPLLAATLARATVREIRHPGDAPPEPQYRPSRALADFVRCRDLTCRWPGCDKPAYGCDIDHTVPWPVGPTHASNTKCYCRFHHLLKTFYCGLGGWRERQLPDGTLILTAPTGHTATTKPGSAHLFPTLCRPTGELHLPTYQPPSGGDRGLMMPKRRRTRAENLAHRIEAERKLNDEYIAERNKPPPF